MGKNAKGSKLVKATSLKGVATASKGIGKKLNNTKENVKLQKAKQPLLQNGKTKKQKPETPKAQNGKVSKDAAKKIENPKVKKPIKLKPQGSGVKKQAKEKAKPVDKENVDSFGQVLKLTKRNKNRVKAEIKKEIILKGKTTAVLSSPNVVKKKLAKLEAKPEPRSIKVQKKILLLKSMLERLEKEQVMPTKNVTASDKKKSSDSIKIAKVEKTNKADGATKSNQFPRNEFVVFVGRLNPSITLDMLREHFKSAGQVQRVNLPVPKKRKSKRFAYIQFESEESRQNALNLHDSMLGDCKINVLYANKGRNKKIIAKQNTELNTKRKANLTDTQMMEVGKILKMKKKPTLKKK